MAVCMERVIKLVNAVSGTTEEGTTVAVTEVTEVVELVVESVAIESLQ